MTNNIQQEVESIWNQNAAFWDVRGGDDGLSMQRTLIDPVMERLLALQPGDRMLEIACGNGAFARRMARQGTNVIACDLSASFIELARARTTENVERIAYLVMDATDRQAMFALGKRSFDGIACSMAVMDMTEIEPMFSVARELLKPNGRFVFSTVHPCFNSGKGMKRVIEEEDREGDIVDVWSIKISNYATPTVYKGLGIIGQPLPQYYFHRSLTDLFGACFRAGFVIDALEEPTYSQDAKANRPMSWESFSEIPPVLVARLRVA